MEKKTKWKLRTEFKMRLQLTIESTSFCSVGSWSCRTFLQHWQIISWLTTSWTQVVPDFGKLETKTSPDRALKSRIRSIDPDPIISSGRTQSWYLTNLNKIAILLLIWIWNFIVNKISVNVSTLRNCELLNNFASEWIFEYKHIK